MKKITALALVLLLALSVGGCGKKANSQKEDAPNTENGAAVSEDTEEQDTSANDNNGNNMEEKESDGSENDPDGTLAEQADASSKEDSHPENAADSAALLPDASSETGSAEDSPVQEPFEEPELTVSEAYHSVTWTQGPTRYVFTHDGTNVKSYTVYMDMGSEEYAKQVLAEALANEELTRSENVKKISTTGQFVIIEYNESAFVYKTYEELKTAAELFGAGE